MVFATANVPKVILDRDANLEIHAFQIHVWMGVLLQIKTAFATANVPKVILDHDVNLEIHAYQIHVWMEALLQIKTVFATVNAHKAILDQDVRTGIHVFQIRMLKFNLHSLHLTGDKKLRKKFTLRLYYSYPALYTLKLIILKRIKVKT